MALDYGERRIGVAVSDPTETIAQPLLAIVRRRGKRPPYTRILSLASEWDAERIIVGLPLGSEGEEGEMAQQVRDFGAGLERRADIPVEYWDERFSSRRARRELALMDLPATARRDKGRVDVMAATLLLQSYLDAHRT